MNTSYSKHHPHEGINSSLLRSMVGKPLRAIGRLKVILEGEADPLGMWFYRSLEIQDLWVKEGWFASNFNYYEFGVGWGGTLISFIKSLKSFCKKKKRDIYQYRIFGFDSFEGLPNQESPKDGHPMWRKGAFSHTVLEIEDKLRREGIDLGRGNMHFIRGFLKDTLTSNLRDTLSAYPPSIVTIDLDYYSSAKLALEWLRPMLRTGVLFYFDDIWSFLGDPNYGELAAIYEFNRSIDSQLIDYPILGNTSMIGKTFAYSKKDWEYKAR